MGEGFKGEKNYSRMMSILMVSLTYSSGMPIVYFVGFIYFALTYVVSKTMLFKYYFKTNTLSRVIPNYSVKFLNAAILIHLLMGCIMYTNPSLFESREGPEHKLTFWSDNVSQNARLQKLKDNMSPIAKKYKEKYAEELEEVKQKLEDAEGSPFFTFVYERT